MTRVSSNDIETRVPLAWSPASSPAAGIDQAEARVSVVETTTAPSNRNAPAARIYPHLFDESGVTGPARTHLLQALKDARLALESFNDVELDGVGTRLALLAASFAAAHRHTAFNENLGAVVSYVRRASLVASVADISRAALNVLINTIEYLLANPSMDLDEAAELTERLESEGWRGDQELVSQLLGAMLGNAEDDEVVQGLLFAPEAASPDPE